MQFSFPKEKKVHPWHQNAKGPDGPGGKGPKPGGPPQMSKEEKALQRRLARDKKRDEKRAALMALVGAEVETKAEPGVESKALRSPPVEDSSDAVLAGLKTAALVVEIGQEVNTLAEGASELHAAVDVVATGSSDGAAESPVLEVRELAEEVRERGVLNAEPRLIVEALVVRKLSIEEATLDFSRLSLA